MSSEEIATRRTALLSSASAKSAVPSSPSFLTGVLASVAVFLAAAGVGLYFVWVYMEYTDNPWEHDVENWKIPRGGPEAPYVQQILMASSLLLAGVAASTSELLVGLRRWRWPYQHGRFFCTNITWVEGVLWFLIFSSMIYWFFYEEITELGYIYWPSSSYSYGGFDDSYDYSYDDGNGTNSSSYAYDGGHDHAPPPPEAAQTTYAELSVAKYIQAHAPHGPPGGHEHGPPGGHEHGPPHGGPHGPPHGFSGGQAKWVQALSDAARQSGLVAMIPISLLGVPLARSSALWRLAGLSYEEAVNFHRWLGLLAVFLTTFHTLGYIIIWTQPMFEFTLGKTAGGLIGIYNELFTQHGVAGLNPWCDDSPQGQFGGLTYNPECCGVSNLAGLIAWTAGILIWLSSLQRVRRSRYLLFIQTHQLHYVFFGLTCAHWSYGLFYMVPSATFYAADIVLRWHGTYTCKAATARVHGQDQGKEPTMVTLLLPVPDSAADATVVAAGGCPFLQKTRKRLAATTVEPSFETDPWAGTTCYLQTRGLSPLTHMGGWSHPFTVAGSIALDNATGAKRALLVHIAPERNWTLRLTRAASKAGGGADVRMADVSVTSPLPAPPHLEHLAHSVMMGKPLLLIGAGSGVTPAVALIRMLASRTLPATARVHLIVIVRSMHVAEALDGYMLPASADGATGLPWLTTELHLTRKVVGADDVENTTSSQVATVHGFQGGFRLSTAGDGTLMAAAAPYRLADVPNLVGDGIAQVTGASKPCGSRRVVIDELATLLGAFIGFVGSTWPLIGAAADAPAPWSYKPTSISGMGALLLGWTCAMVGAWIALLLCDAVTYCSAARTSTRMAASSTSLAQPTTEASSGGGASANSLIVPLTSNGSRPDMKARLEAFADQVASAGGEAGEMLVAAGGPQVLFASIKEMLPAQLHVQRLTHPM